MKCKHSVFLFFYCFITIGLFAQQQENTQKFQENVNLIGSVLVADDNLFFTEAVSIENEVSITSNQLVTALTDKKTIMVKINISTSDDLGERLSGVIEFVKFDQQEVVIEGKFMTNEDFTMELPDDVYYVRAWIPGNNEYCKTWYGYTNLCDSVSNTCSGGTFPVAKQFNVNETELKFDLLEFEDGGLFSRGSIQLNIVDQRTTAATSKPIRDVDITVMKVPPGKAFCPVLPPDGSVRNSFMYSKLPYSSYYVHLYMPGLPLQYKPCIEINSRNQYPLTLYVRDDGIFDK